MLPNLNYRFPSWYYGSIEIKRGVLTQTVVAAAATQTIFTPTASHNASVFKLTFSSSAAGVLQVLNAAGVADLEFRLVVGQSPTIDLANAPYFVLNSFRIKNNGGAPFTLSCNYWYVETPTVV